VNKKQTKGKSHFVPASFNIMLSSNDKKNSHRSSNFHNITSNDAGKAVDGNYEDSDTDSYNLHEEILPFPPQFLIFHLSLSDTLICETVSM
jgi:hypothetical protein